MRVIDKVVDEICKGKSISNFQQLRELSVIEAYILNQPTTIQSYLWKVYTALKDVLPEAKEKLSYGMPTFHWKKNMIHFAPVKHHLGIYPITYAIVYFENELQEWVHSKGAIQFPNKKEIPLEFIQKIALYNLEILTRQDI